jgi:hypothetical protein
VKRRVAAPVSELDDCAAPLGRAIEVGKPVACHERRAARVTDRERVAGLGGRDRHRLVEQGETFLDLAGVDLRQSELGEPRRLQVMVIQGLPDFHRVAGVALVLSRFWVERFASSISSQPRSGH